MKDFVYLTVISLLVLFISVHLFMDELEYVKHNRNTHFIWNDDEESIPMDGELIRIEFTKDSVIYIGPKE